LQLSRLPRLPDLLPWASSRPASEEGERGFADRAAALVLTQARVLTLLLMAAAVLFWPFDIVAMRDRPEALRASHMWRVGVLVVGAITLALFRLFRARRDVIYAIMVTCGAAAVASTAWAVGRIPEPWLPYFFVLPFTTVHISVTLPRRILLNLTNSATCVVTYNVAHGIRPVSVILVECVFMGFAIGGSTLFGHLVYTLARENFLHASQLEQRVADKTQELRHFAEHLFRARETERAYVGRELHDEMGGLFAAMRIEVDRLEAAIAEGPKKVVALDDLLDRGIRTLRAVVADLRPAALDELGFAAAAEELFSGFEARTGIGCAWTMEPPECPLEGEGALVAYRVLQESLTNVARHARARDVEVTIETRAEEGVVRITIADDGAGLQPSQRKGHGVVGMRERVHALGGSFAIAPREGGGTTVTATLPSAAR
jgi:signal transduction histidine kinase